MAYQVVITKKLYKKPEYTTPRPTKELALQDATQILRDLGVDEERVRYETSGDLLAFDYGKYLHQQGGIEAVAGTDVTGVYMEEV